MDPTEGNGNAGYDKAFETVWQKFATTFGKNAMPRFVAPEHQSTGVSKMNEYIDALGLIMTAFMDLLIIYTVATHIKTQMFCRFCFAN